MAADNRTVAEALRECRQRRPDNGAKLEGNLPAGERSLGNLTGSFRYPVNKKLTLDITTSGTYNQSVERNLTFDKNKIDFILIFNLIYKII